MRVTLPFLLVIIVVAGIGVYIVTRLVAGSIEERFANQLVESARAAANSVVDIERQQLATLRAMAFTEGMPEALVARNSVELDELLRPIAINAGVDDVIVFDQTGQGIFQLFLAQNDFANFTPPDVPPEVGQWGGVQRVLSEEADPLGDKYSDLIGEPPTQILYISAPILDDSGDLVGGVSVGLTINDLILRVTQQALSGVAFYNEQGTLLASTFRGVSDSSLSLSPSQISELLAAVQVAPPVREYEFDGVSYQILYSPLQFRSQSSGILAVGLPSNFIVERSGTSRDLFGILFAALFAIVAVLGLLTARTITNPVTWLVSTTRAIRNGDLTRRVGIRTPDELGELATSFDHMTDQLVQRNAEISALYFQQLAETVQRDAVLASIGDVVIVQDVKGRTILQNPAAHNLIESISADKKLLQEFNHFRQSLDNLSTARTVRFSQSYYSVLATPVGLPSGELLGYVLVFRDITAIMETEQIKDELILQLSHELRTPLTAARGYVDLLQMLEREQLSDRGVMFVGNAMDSLSTLERMVNQVIDVSAIMADRFTIETIEVNLADILKELAEKWTPIMQQRSHQMLLNLLHRHIWIEADVKRMTQVFDHLIRNAYSYTLPGGRIEVVADMEQDQAAVYILDNGVGIATDEIDKVFERLYRGRSADAGPTDARGLGLGLYFAERIVKAHGGTLTLQSEVDFGTVVAVKLPLLQIKPTYELIEGAASRLHAAVWQ
jgi:two-component system sensor histidine kinase VicK